MKALLKKVGSNRLLHAQTLTVSFKTPWNYLAETNVAVRSTDDISVRTSVWWCCLKKIRTHFDQNGSL
jgi:hypothetical protein